jgi:hypothetical protein
VDDLTELLRALRRAGWTVEHGTRHWICTPPDAGKDRVTLSSTPSGSRWLYAALRQIRQSDPRFRFRGR